MSLGSNVLKNVVCCAECITIHVNVSRIYCFFLINTISHFACSFDSVGKLLFYATLFFS